MTSTTTTTIQPSQNQQWYNPNHPDADWSGFISPDSLTGKRHYKTNEKSNTCVQIVPNDTGLCPNETSDTLDWKRPGRSNVDGTQIQRRRRKQSIIGGPIPLHDPESVTSEKKWESETKSSFFNDDPNKKCGTKVNQLTIYGRSQHIRGRKAIEPKFVSSSSNNEGGDGDNNQSTLDFYNSLREENPYLLNEQKDKNNRNHRNHSNTENNNLPPFSEAENGTEEEGESNTVSMMKLPLVGYRSHRGGAQYSFLDGLGKELLKDDDDGEDSNKSDCNNSKDTKGIIVSTAPYATDLYFPTDPYSMRNNNDKGHGGRNNKDLILENYSTAPGYTGRRKLGLTHL